MKYWVSLRSPPSYKAIKRHHQLNPRKTNTMPTATTQVQRPIHAGVVDLGGCAGVCLAWHKPANTYAIQTSNKPRYDRTLCAVGGQVNYRRLPNILSTKRLNSFNLNYSA